MKKTKIIFDMDGVITTEQRYWDCAALTVYEAYYDKKYFGEETCDISDMQKNVAQIRKKVFNDDKTISLIKNFGVNSNWDLAYVVFAGAMFLETDDFKAVYEMLKEKNLRAPEIYDFANKVLCEKLELTDCSRNSKLWNTLMMIFQEWYYGDESFLVQYGKKPSAKGKTGFMCGEEPMFSVEETEKFLKNLKNKGIVLGIGTGRCAFEIFTPLKSWGLDKYFDKDSCFTYDKMAEAEQRLGIFLSKPHPYTFLKAAFSDKYSDKQLADGKYDKEYIKQILIVGDAGADLFAAKAINADFAAVLTGPAGKEAKGFFEENSSEYILDNVLDLAKIID